MELFRGGATKQAGRCPASLATGGIVSQTLWRLVIFDLDGTLCDTADDIAQSLNETMRELGLAEFEEARVRDMIGDGMSMLLKRALGTRMELLEKARGRFQTAYSAHLTDHTRPYTGIVELLEQMTESKAVATNKPGPWAREICKRLGLGDFVAVLGDGDVARRKPDPLVIHTILERAGGVTSAETLLVGDSLVDIETARRAGVSVCAVTWGYTNRAQLEAACPDAVVDDVAMLAKWLRGQQRE